MLPYGISRCRDQRPEKTGIQRSQEVSWRSASRKMIYPQHVARCGVLGLQFVGLSAGKILMLRIFGMEINTLAPERESSSGAISHTEPFLFNALASIFVSPSRRLKPGGTISDGFSQPVRRTMASSESFSRSCAHMPARLARSVTGDRRRLSGISGPDKHHGRSLALDAERQLSHPFHSYTAFECANRRD